MRSIVDDIIFLTVVFIGLKLGGQVDWGWWWVLSPIWLGITYHLLVAAFAFMLIGIGSFAKEMTND